jgi:Rhodopirellula transposase DDE domain
MAVAVDVVESLAAKFSALLPHLDERQRRLCLGAEARSLGRGGIAVVAAAAGVSRQMVAAGVSELEAGQAPLGRARREGGGRKRLADLDPGLVPALLALVEPGSRGDPMSPLRWTTRSTRHLAAELTRQGHRAGADTVADLLREQGFSLQGNAKTLEGAQHADRDAQFRYISEQVMAHQGSGDPVVSVDTRKKEQVGEFGNAGREWRPAGDPVRVRDHDFPGELGKVIPYGIYDLAANAGWVSVGTDADTAAFAVESIRRWWHGAGRLAWPAAGRLLITADAGGSNGYRTRAWKTGLAALAAEAGLEITVCHFPPGTSKWNKIEHRLFAHITMNWRGRPLTSHEVIVATIAATTTAAGLRVHAELDPGQYPTGVQISDEQMRALSLQRHHWHGDWNYTLHPRPLPGTSGGLPPAPPLPRRARCDQATLTHPAFTGLPRPDLDALVNTLTVPWSAHQQARRYTARGGPRQRAPGAGRHPGQLDITDHILIALIRRHLRLPQHVIGLLFGVDQSGISRILTVTGPLLARHPAAAPSPGPLRTLNDLHQHAAAAGITLPAITTAAS